MQRFIKRRDKRVKQAAAIGAALGDLLGKTDADHAVSEGLAAAFATATDVLTTGRAEKESCIRGMTAAHEAAHGSTAAANNDVANIHPVSTDDFVFGAPRFGALLGAACAQMVLGHVLGQGTVAPCEAPRQPLTSISETEDETDHVSERSADLEVETLTKEELHALTSTALDTLMRAK